MTHKQDALIDIKDIATRHQLSISDITAYLTSDGQNIGNKSNPIMARLFSYFGGIFIFAGFSVFISLNWDGMDSVPRIIATFGSGLALFFFALITLTDKRYTALSTPLFLMSSFLQPLGIFVMLDEFSTGGDVRHGVLFMASYMFIQQFAVFYSTRRTSLLFTSLFFGCTIFVTLCSLLDMGGDLTALLVGGALLTTCYAIDKTIHKAITAFWYFSGSCLLLFSSFDLVKNTSFEIIFLGICAGLIYYSTWARSRTLLFVGSLSLLTYIGYFSSQHFLGTFGWPVLLILLGGAFIGLGRLALHLNQKYIKNQPHDIIEKI